ncbi:hypothetical protein Nepgr_021980 [Nepenthes gracilis]|uniref:Uncharacterized protein n=1 Tax=Nepenthes gracilis TaxID=150966 RepID=A0AAD3SZN0_NEPGR|nr:hypothetical protein Nepgr_021980 [Nepenthes gracilis]
MKFLTPYDIGEVLGDQMIGQTCYLSQVTPAAPDHKDGDLDLRDEATLQQARLGEVTEVIPRDPAEPEKCVNIDSSITVGQLRSVISFFWKNSNVFA